MWSRCLHIAYDISIRQHNPNACTTYNISINSTIQIPLDEPRLHIQPYHTLSGIEIEKIHVKNVPLPIEQMITESRPSQIETIDLPPISSKPEQLPEVDKNSIISSNIVQVKHIQMPLNEPDLHIHAYRGLSRIKSEKVNVKNVPLPVEQMITETRPSTDRDY